MREVLVQSSSSSGSPTIRYHDHDHDHDGGLHQQHYHPRIIIPNLSNNYSTFSPLLECLQSNVIHDQQHQQHLIGGGDRKRTRRRQQHLHKQQEEEEEEEEEELNKFVGLFVSGIRRSVLLFGGSSGCSSTSEKGGGGGMEIGLPANVRHVAHVTFDRFNGFLGLPVEFETQVPTRPPSASATVFGVSTNSMQLSFDTRGNSVPTILLMMQHRLYALKGLQAEGIFRINPDNGQEESVRDQLNRGLLPENVDVHCLAGLIKAWFRELPTGVLDCLSPEQVMQAQTEQECTELIRLLPPTEFALLDWSINLMADVAQFERLNKMNERNIAMVFAPNMTHMADPLTALMHAVQVMNLLKTLIEKTLREREDSLIDSVLESFGQGSPSESSRHFSLQTILEESSEPGGGEVERNSRHVNPYSSTDESIAIGENKQFARHYCNVDESTRENENLSSESSESKKSKYSDGKSLRTKPCNTQCGRVGQTSTIINTSEKKDKMVIAQVAKSSVEKVKGSNLVNRINLRSSERSEESWRQNKVHSSSSCLVGNFTTSV